MVKSLDVYSFALDAVFAHEDDVKCRDSEVDESPVAIASVHYPPGSNLIQLLPHGQRQVTSRLFRLYPRA